MDCRNPCPFDEEMLECSRDLLAQFRVPYEEERLRAGRNISFTDLAQEILATDGLLALRPDLILLTYAVPDLHHLKCVSAHVNHLLGGGAQSMALSEQGLQAPYTALRVADAYHRSGRCERLLLLVMEQSTLFYYDPLVHDTPLSDTATALVFERGAGPVPGPAWTGTAEQLGELVDRAGAGTLVVAGPWVRTGRHGPTYRCPVGTYCTSVWLAVAEHHQQWCDEYEELLLCDVDPRTGRAHALRMSSSRRPGPRVATAMCGAAR